jgi:hypothetical protein
MRPGRKACHSERTTRLSRFAREGLGVTQRRLQAFRTKQNGLPKAVSKCAHEGSSPEGRAPRPK